MARRKKMNPVNIAVIGAGPKAAALVAKADVLRSVGAADVRVTVFDTNGVGANWRGGYGYSDGDQRLCTPAERDVGFPYRTRFSQAVDAALSARFGWTAFQMARRSYAEWVDEGRPPPLHSKFAEYLSWVFETAGCSPVIGKVIQLLPTNDNDRWRVQYQQNSVTHVHSLLFDGAVITGPGPAKRVPITGTPPLGTVYDGATFWSNTEAVKQKLLAQKPEDRYVVIIGGRGTSAAIVAWFARNGFSTARMHIIANHPLYGRSESHLENRYFSDDESWRQLSPAQRVAMHERLNRGVVWSSMLADLGRATGLSVVHGYVDGIECNGGPEVLIRVRRWNNDRPPLSSSLVIDASGFDAWWFKELFSETERPGRWDAPDRDAMFAAIQPDLHIGSGAWGLPFVHVPGLSQTYGAGLASLMSLGNMSDLILARYVPLDS